MTSTKPYMQTLATMKAHYKKARKAYYNKHPIMSDDDFDKLENRIKAVAPDWAELHKTGVAVEKKTKTALLHFMPSLTKQYPHEVEDWYKKRKITKLILMDKLDGSSVQLVYEGGLPVKLITRGDGIIGGDISFLLPYLNIPKRIAVKTRVVFRIEAVIKEKVFAAKWKGDPKVDKTKFENARNMANGILNRKQPHPGLADLDLVVLGIFNESYGVGLNRAKRMGFQVVHYENYLVPPKDFGRELAAARKASPYRMDGLVLVSPAKIMAFANADKPAWMTAFKQNVEGDDIPTVPCIGIIWQKSSHGRWVPKAKIKPTRIGDVTVEHAALHSAKWMIERPLKKATKKVPNPVQFPGRELPIGPGALLQVVRGGDVIPKIVGVVKAGTLDYPPGDYKWEGIHLVETSVSREAEVDRTHKFFTRLGIEFIADRTIEICYDGPAFLKNSINFVSAWKRETLAFQLETSGLGVVNSAKITAEVGRVLSRGLTMQQLMVASGQFEAGMGERKLQAIVDHAKDMKTDILRDVVNCRSDRDIANVLIEVPGWSTKTVELLIRGLTPFRAWLKEIVKYVDIVEPPKPKKKIVVTSGKLVGQIVTFTGYRDKAQEAAVEAQGAVVQAFKATTTILLYKEGGKLSTKLEKAAAKGIRVTTFDQLKIKV